MGVKEVSLSDLSKNTKGPEPRKGYEPRTKESSTGASNPFGRASGSIKPERTEPRATPASIDPVVPARKDPTGKATRPTPRPNTSNPLK